MPARPSFRALVIGAVFLCVAPVPFAHAQFDPVPIIEKQHQQSAQLAQEWLANSDPRIRAWGAYLVLRDRHTELAPTLLAMLSSYEVFSQPHKDQHDAMLPVLDALIQLNIPVPATEAAKLFPEFPAQSLIFLSRSPDGAPAELLHIFRTADDHGGAWLAAGNLLAARRIDGFSSAVLSAMTVRAQVTITTPGVGRGFGLGGGSSCCGGAVYHEAKAGWPLVGNYRLSVCSLAGAVLLAPGTDPAYYKRTVDAAYLSSGGDSCNCGFEPDLIRQHYLAGLLWASQTEPPLRAQVFLSIAWTSDEQYRKELEAFIGRQQTTFSSVAQKLRAAGLMTAEEAAAARPAITFSIADLRDEPHSPLPPIELATKGVTFANSSDLRP